MDQRLAEKMEEYYIKFVELQEKLKKSEGQRFILEMKFNEMLQIAQEEKRAHHRKLKAQYKRFMDEDKKRQERNEHLVKSLERIDTRLTTLSAKTERVNMLRKQYHEFLLRVSGNKSIRSEEESERLCKSSELLTSKSFASHAYDTCPRQSNEEKLEILDKYLQSLSSQRSKDLLNQERQARDKLSLGMQEENFPKCESNHATAIADDIMNSIYSRYYNKTNLKLKETTDELHKFKADNGRAYESKAKDNRETFTVNDVNTEELRWEIPTLIYEEERLHIDKMEQSEINKNQEDLQEICQTSVKYAATTEGIMPALEVQLAPSEHHKTQDNSLENSYIDDGEENFVEETISIERAKDIHETKPSAEQELNFCELEEPNSSSKQEIELASPQLTNPNEPIPEDSIKELDGYFDNQQEPFNEVENAVPLVMSELEEHRNKNATPEEPIEAKSEDIENEAQNQQGFSNEIDHTVPLMVSQLEQQPDQNATPEGPSEAKAEEVEDEKNEPVKQEPVSSPIENENAAQIYDSNQIPDSNDYSVYQTNEQYDAGGQSQPIYTNDPNEQLSYDPSYGQYAQYQQDHQAVYDEYVDPPIFNEHGQIVQVEYDDQGQIVPQYDESGQLIRLYDQNGHPYYDYDGQYENQEDENADENLIGEKSHDNVDENVDNDAKIDASDKDHDDRLDQQQESHEDMRNQDGSNDKGKGTIVDNFDEGKEIANVMDILDTDTESSKQNVSKVSNDSEFDFS